MRLIDADALREAILEEREYIKASDYAIKTDFVLSGLRIALRCLEEAPTVERAKGEWISVEDKKPRRRAEYLCIYQFGDKAEYRYCGVLMFHPEENAENGYIKGPHFSDEGVNNMKVVYWMPLPEKPDMRGEGE